MATHPKVNEPPHIPTNSQSKTTKLTYQPAMRVHESNAAYSCNSPTQNKIQCTKIPENLLKEPPHT